MKTLETLLAHYEPYNDLEALHVMQLKDFLRTSDNPYDRSNLVAHVVADAWIVNRALEKVVLVEHGTDGKWLAPGGHCDGDPDVLANARREAAEETGLVELKLASDGLFDINVGHVKTMEKSHGLEPEHLHFDVCFAFYADERTPLTVCQENYDVQWVALADIPTIDYFPQHMRRVEKTRQGWGLGDT